MDRMRGAATMTARHDVVLVGGGLQSLVALLALAEARPGARVVLVERAAALGGNHTWCVHADDVPAALAQVIAPALAHRWDGYDVAFPDHARTLASPYAAATSASLAAAVHAAVATRPGYELATGAEAIEIAADHVVLRVGRRLDAAHVVDARGPEHLAIDRAACGYQKFVGLELALARPHGLTRPILMDARLPQTDGFRFMYVLPLGERRVLVEDTYFSDEPALDRAAVTAEILGYAAGRGLPVTEVVRDEHGVLPLPLELPQLRDRAPAWGSGPVLAGYRGGWFHPTTGYSFPVALRVAAFLARDADQHDAGARWDALVAEHRRQLGFALRLNRMLFRWFPPAQRHHVLARFYRFPEATVRRFYALRTTTGDRTRILFGRPPRGLSWRAMLTGRKAA